MLREPTSKSQGTALTRDELRTSELAYWKSGVRVKVLPALHFELHRIEGGLQEMNVGPVTSDHEFPIGPLGIFVSADQKRQGELIEYGVIKILKFLIGKRAEDGAWLINVVDEKFVGEL